MTQEKVDLTRNILHLSILYCHNHNYSRFVDIGLSSNIDSFIKLVCNNDDYPFLSKSLKEELRLNPEIPLAFFTITESTLPVAFNTTNLAHSLTQQHQPVAELKTELHQWGPFL